MELMGASEGLQSDPLILRMKVPEVFHVKPKILDLGGRATPPF